jgi:hypothetical protein
MKVDYKMQMIDMGENETKQVGEEIRKEMK